MILLLLASSSLLAAIGVTSTAYIIIDDKLFWANHINNLCKSLVKYIGILNNLKGILSETIANKIYYSFLNSKLRYIIEIYSTAKVSYLRPPQILQNRLIKVLTNPDTILLTSCIEIATYL